MTPHGVTMFPARAIDANKNPNAMQGESPLYLLVKGTKSLPKQHKL